uniref:Zinc finger, CCHC-type n=1 Tax=Tanacetum cinerariifolium TaxID=118510 RepID=A0A6L2N0W4_TANCI|nr:hypothetical protein [Tanacetum cinerariifolium]
MVHSENNTLSSAFKTFFERETLTGLNFNEWYRSLRIVLRVADTFDYLYKLCPDQPADTATGAEKTAFRAEYKKHNDASRKPVSEHVLEMKGLMDQLHTLGKPYDNDMAVNLINKSLNKDFGDFVNFRGCVDSGNVGLFFFDFQTPLYDRYILCAVVGTTRKAMDLLTERKEEVKKLSETIKGTKNFVDEEFHLVFKTSGHGATKENHLLNYGAYLSNTVDNLYLVLMTKSDADASMLLDDLALRDKQEFESDLKGDLHAGAIVDYSLLWSCYWIVGSVIEW